MKMMFSFENLLACYFSVYVKFKRKTCTFVTMLCLITGVSRGALPHASQQGMLHPFRTYADITLFHFSVPPELSRVTWEFVAFMDGAECPARDVHIYLQHGSYPVMSADNSSFPNLLYLGRSSLLSTVTQASFHGLGHQHKGSPEHRRSIIPVYSPLPGDWFVAAFLSNWDQQLTQQGIGHKCHYSLFSVVLWSTDTDVQTVTPGVLTSLVTHRTFSYYRFYVPEGSQHFSVTISQCELLVDVPHGNTSVPCLSSVSLRARGLPLLPSTPTTSNPGDPYEEFDNDVPRWENVFVGETVVLQESQPHMEGYYYMLVVAEAQAKFNLLVNILECQRFDLRRGWAKLLNSGTMRRPSNSSDETYLSTSTSMSSVTLHAKETDNAGSASSSPPGSLDWSAKWMLATANLSHNVTYHSSLGEQQVNFSVTEEMSQISTEVVEPPTEEPANNATNSTQKSSSCEASCYRMFQLTRVQHSQDFSSTFLLQVDEFFISSLLLPDSEPVLVRMDILPFLDIGGSLSVSLQLDRMLLSFFPSSHLLNVTACLRKGRPPPLHIAGNSDPLQCPSDLALSLSSSSRFTLEATLMVPFPEPGHWYLALQAVCTVNGTKVPCISEELGIDLDVRIQPCVFAGEPCGPKGECERTHHGMHTFSSCLCYGGFSGWGCTDGRKASPPSRQLLGTLSLTISNLLFLPAVALAFKRNLYAEALIYFATTFFSILYHACDEPEYNFCVAKYEVLQFCDFFCSILAFWVTLISLAHLPPRIAAAVHMAGVLIVAIGVEWNRTALVVFLVPVALGILVPVVAWLIRSYYAGYLLSVNRTIVLKLLPGVLLSGVGLVLFAMVETEANYQFVHSAWHMLMGLALLFLLPDGQDWKPLVTPPSSSRHTRNNNPSLLDATSQELCDVNDYYSSNPVFVVPSARQPLVTSES